MPTPAPGVQNERTALAWQRTALSLMAASVALTRLTFHELGLASLVSVVITMPLCLWVLAVSRRRYRGRSSHSPQVSASPGGGVSMALAVSVAVMTLTALAALAKTG